MSEAIRSNDKCLCGSPLPMHLIDLGLSESTYECGRIWEAVGQTHFKHDKEIDARWPRPTALEKAQSATILDLIDDLQRLAEGFAMVDRDAELFKFNPKLAAFVDEARAIAKKWRIR